MASNSTSPEMEQSAKAHKVENGSHPKASTVILSAALVQQYLPMSECVEHTARALRLVQAPELMNPTRVGVPLPLADKEGVHILGFMPCYLADSISGTGDWPQRPGPSDGTTRSGHGGYIVCKIITVFPSNVGSGYTGHQGVVLLYSADNGSLLCIADAHEITGLRTAAASAVATRLLSKPGSCSLAILGSGVQAYKHLEAMECVREISSVRVWSRNKGRAQEFADTVRCDVQVCDSPEEAVRDADIVCTLTPSTAPLVKRAWLKAGAHVNAVGSCNPLQQELDVDCVTQGGVFCDSLDACFNGVTRTGDLVIPLEKGLLKKENVVELGTVLDAERDHNPSGITIFKSVGVAAEDLCSVVPLYEKASAEPAGAIPRM